MYNIIIVLTTYYEPFGTSPVLVTLKTLHLVFFKQKTDINKYTYLHYIGLSKCGSKKIISFNNIIILCDIYAI